MQALSICLHALNLLKYRDMLMTSTSPELLSSTEERVRHVDISVAARRPAPNGKSEAKEAKEDKHAQQEKQNLFELQFSHSCELLHFTPRRILNCVQEAE